MRFSVTNSMETDFLLPPLLENVEPVIESDSEDEGFGSRGKEKKTPPKKTKRKNWVDQVAEDRRRKEKGSSSKEGELDESEADLEDADSEEEQEESSSKKKDSAEKEQHELLASDRSVEMPAILLSWEPLEKFGRAVVQLFLPTFFVAGLELDLGSTIMIRNNTEFGQDELHVDRKKMSRHASMGTIRMVKNTSASSLGRK